MSRLLLKSSFTPLSLLVQLKQGQYQTALLRCDALSCLFLPNAKRQLSSLQKRRITATSFAIIRHSHQSTVANLDSSGEDALSALTSLIKRAKNGELIALSAIENVVSLYGDHGNHLELVQAKQLLELLCANADVSESTSSDVAVEIAETLAELVEKSAASADVDFLNQLLRLYAQVNHDYKLSESLLRFHNNHVAPNEETFDLWIARCRHMPDGAAAEKFVQRLKYADLGVPMPESMAESLSASAEAQSTDDVAKSRTERSTKERLEQSDEEARFYAAQQEAAELQEEAEAEDYANDATQAIIVKKNAETELRKNGDEKSALEEEDDELLQTASINQPGRSQDSQASEQSRFKMPVVTAAGRAEIQKRLNPHLHRSTKHEKSRKRGHLVNEANYQQSVTYPPSAQSVSYGKDPSAVARLSREVASDVDATAAENASDSVAASQETMDSGSETESDAEEPESVESRMRSVDRFASDFEESPQVGRSRKESVAVAVTKITDTLSWLNNKVNAKELISAADFERAFADLQSSGSEVTLNDGCLLLTACGQLMAAESAETKAVFCNRVLGALKSQRGILHIRHAEALISAFLANRYEFSIDEFLENLKAEGLPLSKNIYESLIRACSLAGNLKRAKMLKSEMDQKGFEIGEDVYSWLMYCLLKDKSEDPVLDLYDKYQEQMRQRGLKPGRSSLMAFALASANFGDAEETAKVLVSVGEAMNAAPSDEDMLAIVKVLALNGSVAGLDTYFLDELDKAPGVYGNAAFLCGLELVKCGRFDAAVKVFQSIPYAVKVGEHSLNANDMLLYSFVLTEAPLTHVGTTCIHLEESGVRGETWRRLLQFCAEANKLDYGGKILLTCQQQKYRLDAKTLAPFLVHFASSKREDLIRSLVWLDSCGAKLDQSTINQLVAAANEDEQRAISQAKDEHLRNLAEFLPKETPVDFDVLGRVFSFAIEQKLSDKDLIGAESAYNYALECGVQQSNFLYETLYKMHEMLAYANGTKNVGNAQRMKKVSLPRPGKTGKNHSVEDKMTKLFSDQDND